MGLMYSAAFRELDPPMTSEEVRGILIMSADDIDVPEALLMKPSSRPAPVGTSTLATAETTRTSVMILE